MRRQWITASAGMTNYLDAQSSACCEVLQVIQFRVKDVVKRQAFAGATIG